MMNTKNNDRKTNAIIDGIIVNALSEQCDLDGKFDENNKTCNICRGTGFIAKKGKKDVHVKCKCLLKAGWPGYLKNIEKFDKNLIPKIFNLDEFIGVFFQNKYRIFYIYGPPGAGKTWLSLYMYEQYSYSNRASDGVFLKMTDICDAIHLAIKGGYENKDKSINDLDCWKQKKLIIIDDFLTNPLDVKNDDRLGGFLNYFDKLNANKIIITSNLNPQKIYPPQLESRVINKECCVKCLANRDLRK